MTVAKEHLCFAACVEIAVEQLGGPVVDQVVVANQLGVTVPSELDASQLIARGVTKIRVDPDPRTWGIEPDAQRLNDFFSLAGIPLSVMFHSISLFQDWEFEEKLVGFARAGRFPIVGFDYNALFGHSVQGEQGHSCVVFDCSSTVRLYDPGPTRVGFSSVSVFELYRACRKKPGGLWVLQQSQAPSL